MDYSLSYFFCRLSPSKPIILRGHNDGVSSFSMWGQDVISISRNKIGLSSLSKSADEVSSEHFLTCYCQSVVYLYNTSFLFSCISSGVLYYKVGSRFLLQNFYETLYSNKSFLSLVEENMMSFTLVYGHSKLCS